MEHRESVSLSAPSPSNAGLYWASCRINEDLILTTGVRYDWGSNPNCHYCDPRAQPLSYPYYLQCNVHISVNLFSEKLLYV